MYREENTQFSPKRPRKSDFVFYIYLLVYPQRAILSLLRVCAIQTFSTNTGRAFCLKCHPLWVYIWPDLVPIFGWCQTILLQYIVGDSVDGKAILSIFNGRQILTEVFMPCQRRKKNLRSQIFFSCRRHFENVGCFGAEILPIWEKNILSSQHLGGKNKIKLICQFFFLIWENFISLEDSSPIEYTDSGLMELKDECLGGLLILKTSLVQGTSFNPV